MRKEIKEDNKIKVKTNIFNLLTYNSLSYRTPYINSYK
jgi:hypothetical protein